MPEEKAIATKEKTIFTPKIIVPAVIAVFLIIATVIMAFAVNTSDNIKRGVKINGLDVGGMTTEQARELAIASAEEFNTGAVLSIKCGEETKKVTFGEIMSEYNAEEAVEKAYALGRNGSAAGNFFKSVGL